MLRFVFGVVADDHGSNRKGFRAVKIVISICLVLNADPKDNRTRPRSAKKGIWLKTSIVFDDENNPSGHERCGFKNWSQYFGRQASNVSLSRYHERVQGR